MECLLTGEFSLPSQIGLAKLIDVAVSISGWIFDFGIREVLNNTTLRDLFGGGLWLKRPTFLLRLQSAFPRQRMPSQKTASH
jgi:hypothetical protein